MQCRFSLAATAAALAMLAACGGPTSAWQARESSRSVLLEARNASRMYDGAPPVIPHKVAAIGRTYCLNCHAPGAYDNAERVGPPRSHPSWGDCRQCHVERNESEVHRKNGIQPLRYPANGHRQTEISPPMIPHRIQDREDCAVCHIGKQAPASLRAAHGYRPSCRQCHVATVEIASSGSR